MENLSNIHINDTANVNISLLKKHGLNIEIKFYDKFMETLIKMVKADCKQALSKFSIEDIIGSNSGNFFNTYLQYFEIRSPESTYCVGGTRYVSIADNFLSLDDRYLISGIYIQNNLSKIKDKCKACLINEQEEYEKAMKSISKMFDYFLIKEFVKNLQVNLEPKVYHRSLESLKRGSIYDLLRLLHKPLLEFMTPARDLKNNILTRELEYFLSKYFKAISKEVRLNTYMRIIDSIKSQSEFKNLYNTGFANTETEKIRELVLNNMKVCLAGIELKHFPKNPITIKEFE